MKPKHLKLTLAFTLLFGAFPVYSNFKINDWTRSKMTLESVHEASRAFHAQELLGKDLYKASSDGAENRTDLNTRILAQVKHHLPAAHKNEAAQITQTLILESSRHQMDPVFVMAIIKTESQFNPAVVGSHGEIGFMQIKPDTAAWISRKYNIKYEGPASLFNPNFNIKVGLAYMNYLRKNFNKKAVGYVSAYNMGPLNVRRLLAKNIRPYEYKSRVMQNYSQIYGDLNADNKILVASN